MVWCVSAFQIVELDVNCLLFGVETECKLFMNLALDFLLDFFHTFFCLFCKDISFLDFGGFENLVHTIDLN